MALEVLTSVDGEWFGCAVKYGLQERRGELKLGEGKKIYSNCAGVTFSHNPSEMPPVSGHMEAEKWWEEESIYCRTFVKHEVEPFFHPYNQYISSLC